MKKMIALFVLLTHFSSPVFAESEHFALSEFNLGGSRAVQGGGAAGGPLLAYLPHYEFQIGEKTASLGLELGVTSFHDAGESNFIIGQYGIYEAFRFVKNFEIRVSVGIQTWNNSHEVSPYLGTEARLIFNHPEQRYVEGLYAFYNYVANTRPAEILGGGLVLHWPSSQPSDSRSPAAVATIQEPSVVAAEPHDDRVATMPPAAPAPAAPTDNLDNKASAVAFISSVKSGPFHYSSVYLGQEYVEKLKLVGQTLAKYPELKLTISGFTSDEGNEARKLELSRHRAEKVRDVLLNTGAAPSQLTVLGLGATRMISSEETEEARASNRRVELSVE